MTATTGTTPETIQIRDVFCIAKVSRLQRALREKSAARTVTHLIHTHPLILSNEDAAHLSAAGSVPAALPQTPQPDAGRTPAADEAAGPPDADAANAAAAAS